MQPTVQLDDVSLRLGAHDLWKHLQLSITPGEFLTVLGPNGAGKSSFLGMLLGLHTPTRGSVTVLQQTPRQARQRIGYIPQQKAFDSTTPISGRDLVGLGVNGHKWFGTLSHTQRQLVERALRQLGAQRYAHKPIGQLSGGEQQRLRIAQALVDSPALVLCDEPLLSLDIASQHQVCALLDAHRKQGAAVVFVTHEINPVLPFTDRVLYLVDGKWTIGTPNEVLTSARLSELYGVPVEVLRVHGRVIVVAADGMATEPHDPQHHLAHDEVIA